MADVTSQPGGTGNQQDSSGPRQSEDRTKPGFEPTQEEKDAVKVWSERVERAEINPERKVWVDLLAELRGYVSGVKHDDKTGKTLTRSNMVYATLAAMMPALYAKNPDIGVTPTDSVPEASIGNVKLFASTAERVIDKMLVEEGRLKKRVKANIRAASTTSIGVLKMVYQKEFRGDPIIIHRIEDAQFKLNKVEALIQALKKEEDPTKLATQRDELRSLHKSLLAHNEVSIFKGFAVDRLKSEDFLILDDSIVEFDDYVDAKALGQRTWMTVDSAEQLLGVKMNGATKYGRPRGDDATSNSTPDKTAPGDMFVCVVEIWDKENGVVRTWVKGMSYWAREPYAPPHAPQRWYPFYVLAFNVIEGRWRPISDVELLKQLQDEYNTTRTNYADIREKANPKRIIRKGGNLTEDDVKNVMASGNKDWVAVEGNPTVPITQDVMDLPGQKIDPQAYDVTLIRNDMDLMVGLSDASRSNLIKPKTATEAELMQEALQNRVAERRDTNEDLMSEMGAAALEIALKDLTKAEVQQLAGEECEWPDAPESSEQVLRQVVVRVRAGSTGKPNQAKEREQWGQLLPQISEAMKQVADLRAQGNYTMADAVVSLLRETLRRFDEHLDLDSIIPPVKKGEDGRPEAETQAAAELVKVKQQVEELQQALAKCQQDLQKAQAAEQAQVAKINADKEAKIAQARVDEVREGAIAARERQKSEEDASFRRWDAVLQAATKIISGEINASITANAKDPAAQQAAVEASLSDKRMQEIITDLQKTMTSLESAFDRVAAVVVKPQQGAGA